MSSILQCPVCGNVLLNAASTYHCPDRHSFDKAREGYVNLLPANRKHSREPGDSTDMIRSRRRFLGLGFYDGLSDGINETVSAIAAGSASPGVLTILDAGCGEGFYLARLRRNLSMERRDCPAAYYGIDISKFAVRQAAGRDRTITWLVAGVSRLPFTGSSLAVILNVFAPAHIAEFSRTLKKTGFLVMATPGAGHLAALRRIIYPVAREHPPSSFPEQAKGRFTLMGEKKITYRRELKGREAIMDLLAMTPYYWNIDRETRARVEGLADLALDVDVDVRTYVKTS